MKLTIIKLSEENSGENFLDLGLEQKFLEMILKAYFMIKIINRTSSKLKPFALSKTLSRE